MPPNGPEHNEGKEQFSQQIEKSIDDRIRELQYEDGEKGQVLQNLKSAIVEKIVMPHLDDRGRITGSKIDDLRLDEGEMGQVFDLLQKDPTVQGLLEKGEIKTPEDFMVFLGIREISSDRLGLQNGPANLKEDANIFGANGKIMGLIFRNEKVQITDATPRTINGTPHVLVTATHDLGRYRPKYAGKTKEYTGYIPVKGLQGNMSLSAAPEPTAVDPAPTPEPAATPSPEPDSPLAPEADHATVDSNEKLANIYSQLAGEAFGRNRNPQKALEISKEGWEKTHQPQFLMSQGNLHLVMENYREAVPFFQEFLGQPGILPAAKEEAEMGLDRCLYKIAEADAAAKAPTTEDSAPAPKPAPEPVPEPAPVDPYRVTTETTTTPEGTIRKTTASYTLRESQSMPKAAAQEYQRIYVSGNDLTKPGENQLARMNLDTSPLSGKNRNLARTIATTVRRQFGLTPDLSQSITKQEFINAINRLANGDNPEPAPSTPRPPEAASLSGAEVLQRREQITNYYKAAYDKVCYDYEKAAQQAGFKDRQEADQYLSELTGSKYGPDLKTGDMVTTPNGDKAEYFATAKDVSDALTKIGDTTSLQALYYKAHAYAQENHQVLNVQTVNAPVIYAALVRAKVFDMKIGQRLQEAESGVTFEKTKDGIYFNSQADDNTWGRLDTGMAYSVKYEGKFISVETHEHFGPDSVLALIADTPQGKIVFDAKGAYSEALTKLLAPDASAPRPEPPPVPDDMPADPATFAREAAEYLDGDTLNARGKEVLRLLNNEPQSSSPLRVIYRFEPKITEPITEAQFVAKLKEIKEPAPFVDKAPVLKSASPKAARPSPPHPGNIT